jgi:osmotically-inducible protein OsmY
VDDLRHRLAVDTRLHGVSITVVEQDNQVRLQGIVPNEQIRQCIYDLAVHTNGIAQVIDELAVVVSTAHEASHPAP